MLENYFSIHMPQCTLLINFTRELLVFLDIFIKILLRFFKNTNGQIYSSVPGTETLRQTNLRLGRFRGNFQRFLRSSASSEPL